MKIEIIKGHDNEVAEFFSSPARPTPEADTFFLKRGAWSTEVLAFCRKLEKERDEWAAMCGRYKQERDELLKKTK
jgi:hypothetical protein